MYQEISLRTELVTSFGAIFLVGDKNHYFQNSILFISLKLLKMSTEIVVTTRKGKTVVLVVEDEPEKFKCQRCDLVFYEGSEAEKNAIIKDDYVYCRECVLFYGEGTFLSDDDEDNRRTCDGCNEDKDENGKYYTWSDLNETEDGYLCANCGPECYHKHCSETHNLKRGRTWNGMKQAVTEEFLCEECWEQDTTIKCVGCRDTYTYDQVEKKPQTFPWGSCWENDNFYCQGCIKDIKEGIESGRYREY